MNSAQCILDKHRETQWKIEIKEKKFVIFN